MENILSTPFPLVTQTLTIAQQTWRLTFVEDQDKLMARVQTEEDLENFPYGLMLWPSALGLAARLREEPTLVQGIPTLEIGAGAGLVGMVAASLGALVTQTDYLKDALRLCQHNARLNGIPEQNLTVRQGDWRCFPTDLQHRFPLVLGADILYERTLHSTLLTLLPTLIAPGGRLIISDPIRPQAMDFLEAWERTNAWPITLESRKVLWQDTQKDLALIHLHRPHAAV